MRLSTGKVQSPQTGQAMLEFAIIVLLLFTLVVGGTELGIAAFNSNRTSESAKVGTLYWLEAGLTYAQNNGSGGFVLNMDGSTDAYGNPSYTAADFGLGNHDPSLTNLGRFDFPICIYSTNYVDNGLPVQLPSSATDNNVYLFNPLPIDVTDCFPPGGGNTNAVLDALFENNPLGEPGAADGITGRGLPPIHQSLRSLYELRCYDSSLNPLACSDPGVTRRFWHLPGSLDPVNEVVYLAYLDGGGNLLPNTPDPDTGGIRPVFDVACAAQNEQFHECDNALRGYCACDAEEAPADICWSTDVPSLPLACNVQVKLRYRHVFESLLMLTYGDPVVPGPAARAAMDTGPEGPKALGSEYFARGNVRKFQRTFLGCYESILTINNSNPAVGALITGLNVAACN